MFPLIAERISRRAMVLVASLGLVAGSPAQALDLFAASSTFVYKYDVATGAATTILNNSGSFLWYPATDVSGNVYVSDYNNKVVLGITNTGGNISGYNQISLGFTPLGMTINPSDSKLVVSDYNNTTPASIYSVPSGTSSGTTSFSVISHAQGMSYDAASNLYIAQNGLKTVTKNGVTLISYTAGPESVFVDQASSKLYVTLNDNRVGRYDLSGNVDTSFGTNGFVSITAPFGVAVAGSSLFVTTGSNINKYDLSGNLIAANWITTPYTLRGLAVSVPEPSTYALAVTSTGVLGFATRRRKARRA